MAFFRKLFGNVPPLDAPSVAADQPASDVVSSSSTSEPLADGTPSEQPIPAATQQAGSADAEIPWWEEGDSVSLSTPGVVEPDRVSAAIESFPADQPVGDVLLAALETASDEELEEDGTRPLQSSDTPALVALRSRLGLATAAQRDIGRVRSINQDSIFALTTTLPRESHDVTIGLFIVADGMGGHDGGEVASRLAISTIAHCVLSDLVIPALTDTVTEALQPLLIAAVQEANRTIWEHAQTVGSDMGTTCTVALLLGQALYIGHVGDSRAYLATPTGLRLLTSDHSTVGRLIQLGQLEPSEAREHPLRSQLYRTVGQHPEVLVDFIYQPVNDATHLLLCSDGLWGMLDEEVLLDVLEHTVWPQDACRELIARANLAGGDDNIGVVVVTLPSFQGR